jgi:hypothetical protein
VAAVVGDLADVVDLVGDRVRGEVLVRRLDRAASLLC